jgi:Domain of unknown function (DUF397).
MSPKDLSGAVWRKSLRSTNGDCIEVARLTGGRVGVRDSEDPGGPVLVFTVPELDAFLRGIKDDSVDV